MTPPRTTSLEMLAKLVAFDTTSRHSNLALIHFVRDYLAEYGIASTLVHDATKQKANLWATIGPEGDGGVVLSGHTDVVPVDGQAWSTDPWVLTPKDDGRIYGRGTCDMKAFSAIALAMVPEFQAAGLKVPVHLALSYDEEVGCIGVHGLIDQIKAIGVKPRLAIIGEPTMMRVVDAHKAIRSFYVEVTGHEAHSSNVHKGVSAVMVAADLIAKIAEIGRQLGVEGDATGRFDPPYSTCIANTIEGGTAQNILARKCRFTYEVRSLPGIDGDAIAQRFADYALGEVLPWIQRISPDANITITRRAMSPPLLPEPGSDVESFVMALAERNAAEAVSYATEAGIFQDAGIPAVVCGPGDIAQAHQPDEFIEASQIPRCEAFMRRLIGRLV
ncbi:Acetylornithine deacetylase [Alphaproteobacteria bacterium SO-S41]|nr:Acetylornithine deacetylase [Alphaproteobacteria bacterium SO-S41]